MHRCTAAILEPQNKFKIIYLTVNGTCTSVHNVDDRCTGHILSYIYPEQMKSIKISQNKCFMKHI